MDYQRRTSLPRPEERLPLGRGLEVSPYCIGIVKDPDTILEAFDQGINFFFVSTDLHWPLYENIRRGLERLFARGGGIRDQVVVCSVCYLTQPDFDYIPHQELIRSVKGLERTDVMVAGGCHADEFPRRQRTMETYLEAGTHGCRAQGISFHDRGSLRTALNEDATDIAFLRYNPMHPGAQKDVFPHLRRPRRGLCYGFKSSVGFQEPALLEGLGLGDYWMPARPDYYRLALMPEAMDGLLFSPGTPKELKEALAAFAQGPLDPDEEEQLMSLASPEFDELRKSVLRLAEAQGYAMEPTHP